MVVLNCAITKKLGGHVKSDFITERQTGPQCDLSDVKCSEKMPLPSMGERNDDYEQNI